MTVDSIALFILLISMALLLHWLPLWRRSALWFGLTVAPEFADTAAARQVLRQYRVEMWILSLGSCLLLWAGIHADAGWMLALCPLLELLGAAIAFARGRNRTRPFALQAAGTRSAPLVAASGRLPFGVPGILVPYAMLLAAALCLQANWQRLPRRFPIHWGLAGNPDRWAALSWQSVGAPLLAGLAVIALLHMLGYLIVTGSPRARVAGTADWSARFRLANLRLIVAMGWMLGALFAVLALNPLLAAGDTLLIPAWLLVAVPLAVAAGLLWPIVSISREPGSGGDGTPDACWKWGQIYYNPHDPALMVEKRFGIGYTVNFGNRSSWLLIALLLLIVLLAVAI
jgi:uncharacterized membrane protein